MYIVGHTLRTLYSRRGIVIRLQLDRWQRTHRLTLSMTASVSTVQSTYTHATLIMSDGENRSGHIGQILLSRRIIDQNDYLSTR